MNLLAIGLFAVPLLSGLLGVVQRHYGARAGEGIIYDLRSAMYQHLQHMSLRFFTNTRSGEVVSRFNSDVVGAQNAITGTIPDIVTNVVTLVSTLAVMLADRVAAGAAFGDRVAVVFAAGQAGRAHPARHPAHGHGSRMPT